jgi:hypothetical protein
MFRVVTFNNAKGNIDFARIEPLPLLTAPGDAASWNCIYRPQSAIQQLLCAPIHMPAAGPASGKFGCRK